MRDKYERQTRSLQIRLFMVQYPAWTHIEGNFYRYDEDLYDLTKIALDKLDQLPGNVKHMIKD